MAKADRLLAQIELSEAGFRPGHFEEVSAIARAGRIDQEHQLPIAIDIHESQSNTPFALTFAVVSGVKSLPFTVKKLPG